MAQGLPSSFQPIEDDKKGLPDSFQPVRPEMNFAIVNDKPVPVNEPGFLDNHPFLRRFLFGPNEADLAGTPAEGMKIVGPEAMKIPGIESIFGAASNMIPGNNIASKVGRFGIRMLGDTIASGFDPRTAAIKGSVLGPSSPPDFVAPKIPFVEEQNIRVNPQTGESFVGDSLVKSEPAKLLTADELPVPKVPKSKVEEELLAALGPEEKPTESLKNGLPIRKGAVTQDHINSLFKSIEDNPNLTPDEKFSAKAELTKVLTGTANEQAKILPKVIGKDLTETLEKSPKTQRLGERLASINGTSKAIMASTDLSAPLRQGLPLIYRKEYWKAFFDMPKILKNEDFFNGLMQSIREDPMFKAADKAGLHITDIHAHSLAKREEAFMTTFAEKIPGVAASERAYTGFLNKLRFDTYKSMIANAQKAGLDVEKLAPEIAHYINVSTGRGSLGMFENSAVLLNQGLFSPRMISSRLTMLNPAYYYKLPKPVRMEALKSLFAVAAVSGTVTGLAKAAGAEVSTDPFSADFGKIKVGNTRLDPYAGFQQYIVAADRLARYAYNRSVDTPSELKNFYGPYKRPNAVEVLGNFARSKESPLVSFAHDMATGKDYAGRPVHLAPMDWNDRGEIADRYIPLLIQDVMDLAKDDPKLLPLAIPAGFGMGIQTYGPRKSAPAR